MTERIDHAAEARELIEAERKPSPAGWETADAQHLANLIEAQALATLALVEQQRIANLIALSQTVAGDGSRPLRHLSVVPVSTFDVGPTDEIAAALGLKGSAS